MSEINWARLYEQGRCKLPGVPWNEQEQKAVYELQIPAKYVRLGVLTQKAYDQYRQNVSEDPNLALIDNNKADLLKKAKELGLTVTPDIRDDDLIRLIQEKQDSVSTTDSEDKPKELVEGI